MITAATLRVLAILSLGNVLGYSGSKRCRYGLGQWCILAVAPVLLVLLRCGPSKEQQAIDACNRGIAHDKRGEYDKAIADYTETIRLDPKFAEAYHNRSLTYAERGQYDKAWVDVEDYQRLGAEVPPAILAALRKGSGRKKPQRAVEEPGQVEPASIADEGVINDRTIER